MELFLRRIAASPEAALGFQCRQPKPSSQKGIVFQAGCVEGGGSITAVAKQTGRTTSNVRQHIAQCHKEHGYGLYYSVPRERGDEPKTLLG